MTSINNLLKDPDATAKLDKFRDSTDPSYVGPGTWNLLHRQAFDARSPDKQKEFINLMKDACYGFPCINCRVHCSDYINNHPLEEFLNSTIEINGEKLLLGMFVWTWKFHNAVNKRIGKPIMSWDTAYNLYSASDSLVCSKACLDSDKKH